MLGRRGWGLGHGGATRGEAEEAGLHCGNMRCTTSGGECREYRNHLKVLPVKVVYAEAQDFLFIAPHFSRVPLTSCFQFYVLNTSIYLICYC